MKRETELSIFVKNLILNLLDDDYFRPLKTSARHQDGDLVLDTLNEFLQKTAYVVVKDRESALSTEQQQELGRLAILHLLSILPIQEYNKLDTKTKQEVTDYIDKYYRTDVEKPIYPCEQAPELKTPSITKPTEVRKDEENPITVKKTLFHKILITSASTLKALCCCMKGNEYNKIDTSGPTR